MKSIRTAGFALLMVGGISACTTSPDQVSVTTNSDESTKVGYSFGYTLGQTNRELIGDINVDAFVTGFREAFDEADSQMTTEEMQTTLEAYQQKKENEFLEDLKTKAATNLTAGEEFLTKNAKKEGIITTESGLQYEVLEAGSGTSPTASDSVKVDYEGRLIDGTVFDSSIERGQPAVFGVSQVIAGWTEGLQLMKPGAKYRFFIPADLAYGETGNQSIEPNSVLIFDVTLMEVNPS